jgi:hypothetical protein
MTSKLIPLAAADRISARFSPKVHRLVAARADRCVAQMAALMAAASVSMCAASASKASDLAANATMTSPAMKPRMRASAT